jgi:Recombination endonuclease VII
VLVAAGEKWCPDCGAVKRLDDFPRNRRTNSGIAAYCKPCHNARGKATYERLYGGTRHYHLKRRYGLSAEEVDALVLAQRGRCAICREAPAEHVDHDHLTGKVRGVLCFNCNGGLGQFRDRADLMAFAIAYLQGATWAELIDREGVSLGITSRPASRPSPSS